MTDPDAEYEAIAAMLSQAGLVEQTIDAGKPAYRLTAEGKRVAEQMALSSEDDARAILDAAAGREGAVGKPYATPYATDGATRAYWVEVVDAISSVERPLSVGHAQLQTRRLGRWL